MTLYPTMRQLIREGTPFAVATVIAGPEAIGEKLLAVPDRRVEGSLGHPDLDRLAARDAERLVMAEESETLSYDVTGASFDVFVDVYPAPARLLIVGAAHAAESLCRMASLLGYRVVVTDARAAFARRERFPDADQVIKGWPQDVLPDLKLDSRTFVVLLSHDPRFDEPTLDHVLNTDVRYIGAIGSRATQRQRFERLRASGYTEEQIDRISGPVGLDIGAKTPEEIALSILAEVSAVRRGKEGGFLRRRPAERASMRPSRG